MDHESYIMIHLNNVLFFRLMECQLCGNIAIDQENDFKKLTIDVGTYLDMILPVFTTIKINPMIQPMTCYIGYFIEHSCQYLDERS